MCLEGKEKRKRKKNYAPHWLLIHHQTVQISLGQWLNKSPRSHTAVNGLHPNCFDVCLCGAGGGGA